MSSSRISAASCSSWACVERLEVRRATRWCRGCARRPRARHLLCVGRGRTRRRRAAMRHSTASRRAATAAAPGNRAVTRATRPSTSAPRVGSLAGLVRRDARRPPRTSPRDVRVLAAAPRRHARRRRSARSALAGLADGLASAAPGSSASRPPRRLGGSSPPAAAPLRVVDLLGARVREPDALLEQVEALLERRCPCLRTCAAISSSRARAVLERVASRQPSVVDPLQSSCRAPRPACRGCRSRTCDESSPP